MKRLICKKIKNTMTFLWQEIPTRKHRGMSLESFRAKLNADLKRAEKKKRLAVSGRKQQAVYVGQYEFAKATPRTNNLTTEKVDYSILLPERTCEHCGKTFCLPYGHTFEKYTYKERRRGTAEFLYFCSWSCLAKWRRENETRKERVTTND